MKAPEPAKSASFDASALVSPRDIANAIGASESSLRRWIDSGDIRVSRTAGGHRRVPLRDALQFIRKIGAVIVHPEMLQLPPLTESSEVEVSGEEESLFAALCEGRRDAASGITLSWYLKGRPLHEPFDGPIRGAMKRVGELWKHEDRGILVEHRATEICISVISSLRSLLPTPSESAPLAIGAAPEGDPYQIPSMMAGTVLAEAGLREVNFGANTPLKLLTDEAALAGAALVWLSISAVADEKTLQGQIKKLATALAARGTKLVIGGHGSAPFVQRRTQNVFGIRSMSELAAFGHGLLAQPATAKTTAAAP
jgi:methanogenic corrinoid protein MtbC1